DPDFTYSAFLHSFPTRRSSDLSRWTNHQNYLIKGLLNRRMIFMVAGMSNAGKSPLALDMGAHIALEKRWRGRRVRGGYVLYVSRSEEHTSELQSRENLVCRLLL